MVEWCIVPWNTLLFKIVMLSQFLRVSWNFGIFHDRLGQRKLLILGNVRKSHYCPKFGCMMQCSMKRITIWNGQAQPIVTFSDLGRPRVLSLSERLVLKPFSKMLSSQTDQASPSTLLLFPICIVRTLVPFLTWYMWMFDVCMFAAVTCWSCNHRAMQNPSFPTTWSIAWFKNAFLSGATSGSDQN